jgi:hypothetical protein
MWRYARLRSREWQNADYQTYRRFLRARKFDVEGAWTQFKDTEDWRKDNAIEALYENIGVDSYEAARRMVRYIYTASYCRSSVLTSIPL